MFGVVGGVAVGFNAFLCSLYLSLKFLPDCPMYAMLQSGQVSLYAPERVYFSVDICLFPIPRDTQ